MKLLSDLLFRKTVEQRLFFLFTWYNKMNRLANSTNQNNCHTAKLLNCCLSTVPKKGDR